MSILWIKLAIIDKLNLSVSTLSSCYLSFNLLQFLLRFVETKFNTIIAWDANDKSQCVYVFPEINYREILKNNLALRLIDSSLNSSCKLQLIVSTSVENFSVIVQSDMHIPISDILNLYPQYRLWLNIMISEWKCDWHLATYIRRYFFFCKLL